jgi:foldase protein PrsA
MKLILPLLLAVSVGALGSTALVGCGDSDELPDDAVAQVGDTPITKADFEEALLFATGRDSDPRDRGACVARKRREATQDGDTPAPEAELAKQCRRAYEQIKANVMDYLIKAEWTRQEAERRDIVVTDAQVKRVVANAQEGGLLDTTTLKRAGVGEEQLLARVRQNQLQARITEQVTQQAREVSSQDITDYYRQHKAEFVLPKRRKARIVITGTRARAQAAKAALRAGRSWTSVANEYSIHPSRSVGGRITAEQEPEDKAGLGVALFRARAGDLRGPFRYEDSWAVFVAGESLLARQVPLGEAREEIVERLRDAHLKQAVSAYNEEYRKKTTCAAGFMVPACKNGPKKAEEPAS